MTEAEWLAATDPQQMLRFLRDRGASDRKMRLFACACCRRIWSKFPDDRNRALVVAVEDHPDGRFEDPDIHDAGVASSACEHEFRQVPAYWVAKYLGRGFYKLSAEVSAAIVSSKALFLADRDRGREVEEGLSMLMYGQDTPVALPPDLPPEVSSEAAAQADALRCIFSPFRTPGFPASWRSATAIALARTMYAVRDFVPMPILADALQDAGCDDAEVLGHCRAATPHVRGCWVADLVLDKK